MTASTDEPLDERLEGLLSEAQDALADADADLPSAELRDVADEVADIVAASDTSTLLEATGIDDSDGEDRLTIPEALARGDDTSVVRLRTVLLLSKLSTGAGDEESASLEKLRELSRNLSAPDEADPGDQPQASAEEGEESTGGDQGESVDTELESELTGAIDHFRERVETARDALSERLAESDSDGDADVDEGPDEDADETGDDELDGSGTERRSVHRRGAFSTLPSSERADMKQPKRVSTLTKSQRKD